MKRLRRWLAEWRYRRLLNEQTKWMIKSMDLLREIDPDAAAVLALDLNQRLHHGDPSPQMVEDVTDMVLDAMRKAQANL